jgi:hypothetical protein
MVPVREALGLTQREVTIDALDGQDRTMLRQGNWPRMMIGNRETSETGKISSMCTSRTTSSVATSILAKSKIYLD